MKRSVERVRKRKKQKASRDFRNGSLKTERQRAEICPRRAVTSRSLETDRQTIEHWFLKTAGEKDGECGELRNRSGE